MNLFKKDCFDLIFIDVLAIIFFLYSFVVFLIGSYSGASLFFILFLGACIWFLGNSCDSESREIIAPYKALAKISILLTIFCFFAYAAQFFSEAIFISAEKNSEIYLFKNLKTLEGGFLALTALIISIISGIYIWALQTAKQNADRLIKELGEVSAEEIRKIRSSQGIAEHAFALASSRVDQLISMQRAITGLTNKNGDEATKHHLEKLDSALSFEKAAFKLIKSARNPYFSEHAKEQINAVSSLLVNNNFNELLSIDLINYLIQLLRESELIHYPEARKLLIKLDEVVLWAQKEEVWNE